MVPPEVLAYRSMLVLTLSQGRPTRRAISSRILMLGWCGNMQVMSPMETPVFSRRVPMDFGTALTAVL